MGAWPFGEWRGLPGQRAKTRGSALALPSSWASPAPLCLQVCPPETPLPLPSTVPEAVRAWGEGHLCSWSSVDGTPVSPAIFLLYSRGSPLPLWSKTTHTLHNRSASIEHLLYAQSCARCCPNTYSKVRNSLGMWSLSITGLMHHGQYQRADESRWCWVMRPVRGIKTPCGWGRAPNQVRKV